LEKEILVNFDGGGCDYFEENVIGLVENDKQGQMKENNQRSLVNGQKNEGWDGYGPSNDSLFPFYGHW
jgi:hypothetical protein